MFHSYESKIKKFYGNEKNIYSFIVDLLRESYN